MLECRWTIEKALEMMIHLYCRYPMMLLVYCLSEPVYNPYEVACDQSCGELCWQGVNLKSSCDPEEFQKKAFSMSMYGNSILSLRCPFFRLPACLLLLVALALCFEA
jgi:hypothetical protein